MQYSDVFIKDYLEKIFYFCLKKTGNEYQANDLTSDICFEVISSLSRGHCPQYFSAWIWKIARNCYSKWAKQKHLNTTRIEDNFETVIETKSDDTNIESEYILLSEIRLLRRELSLIRSDYRKVLVAHYIEDKSISVIAYQLGIPVGTVKTRLQNSRKKLKEGMSMAREFGIRSYKPEEISFVMTAGLPGKNGNPFDYVWRKIPKNILLETYQNPSTIEELSLELGISSVYMEEEVAILEKHDLLKHSKSKYETNFCIISSQAQSDIYNYLSQITPELTAFISEYIDKRSQILNENNIKWHYGFQPYDDMKWTLLMIEVDKLWEAALNKIGMMPNESYPVHSDGGTWILTGYEEYNEKKPKFVSLNGCISDKTHNYSKKVHFTKYTFDYKDLAKYYFELNEQLGLFLQNIVCGEDANSEYLNELLDLGCIVSDKSQYKPNILVFTAAFDNAAIPSKDAAVLNEIRNDIIDKLSEFMQYYCDRIKQDIPDHLKIGGVQINNIFRGFIIRGAVLEEALRIGYISYNIGETRTMLGASMTI
jgi:RNA polymerase sigma factor (sigma-70 family)